MTPICREVILAILVGTLAGMRARQAMSTSGRSSGGPGIGSVGAQVSGRVVDEHGDPVFHAAVLLYPGPSARAFTDKQGRFHFSHVEGKIELRAMAFKPRAVTSKAVTAGAGDEVTLKVSDTAVPRLRGRVVDADGRPVGGVHVVVGAEDPTHPGNYTAMTWGSSSAGDVTDSNGRYDIQGVWPDIRHAVIASRAPKHAISAFVRISKPGESHEMPDIILK